MANKIKWLPSDEQVDANPAAFMLLLAAVTGVIGVLVSLILGSWMWLGWAAAVFVLNAVRWMGGRRRRTGG